MFIHVSVSSAFASFLDAKNPRKHMTTKGVPYSWKILQKDGNDEVIDIARYSLFGAPEL